MKKFLTVILTLLATVSLFAANGTLENMSPVSLDAVPVTFDLGPTGTTYKVGFTSSIENVKEGSVDEIAEDLTTIELALDETQTYGTLVSPVYVYWVISGGMPLTITLNADAAMDGTTSVDSHINWATEWTKYTNDTANGSATLGITDLYTAGQSVNYTDPQTVFDRTSVKSVVERGYTQLVITTQNVTEAEPDEYTGYLQLVITPKG